MSPPPALFLAFACLASAVSAQPACDIGDSEDFVLLQRDSSANSLALVGNIGDNAALIKALEELSHRTSYIDGGDSADYKEQFASNIGGTIQCLAPASGCSKAMLARFVLSTFSTGLATITKYPGLSLFVELAEIVPTMFFPSKHKTSPLTLENIGDVMKITSDEDVEMSIGGEYWGFRLDLATVQTMIVEIGLPMKSNQTSGWTQFHDTLIKTDLSRLVDTMGTNWEDMVQDGGWVQTEITSCKGQLSMLRKVAGQLSLVSNAMALLPFMALAVYNKFGKEEDTYLNNFKNIVVRTVKTSLKANKALQQMGTECPPTDTCAPTACSTLFSSETLGWQQ